LFDTEILRDLRFRGYSPRTMLDIGAHVGAFTRTFLETFPNCTPTLVEPNPFCQDALANLPYERHAVAASSKCGQGNLFLTREWLQSTGSSLYRENTAFFRDEVVIERQVEKARLDDLFRGRRFDFVKIDTQGSELDVLKGGEAVLRQADYILVEISLIEYNAGAPRPEEVFAQLARMGFRQATVTEFHRIKEVNNGGLFHMDFLFERRVQRPSQNYAYAPIWGHTQLMDWLRAQKAACPDFTVIDVGAALNPWSADVLDATFDLNECGAAPLHFRGNFNDPRAWEPLLSHVARRGRFSYCICSHTLEDLAYPAIALEMLPRIAEAGYVAVPSRYLECAHPEGRHRGFIHHRWVLDNVGETLVLAPKLPFTEFMQLAGEPGWGAQRDRFEFQMMWRGAIDFTLLNGDFMGPTKDRVVGMFTEFLDRA
jgi:FkbM family methyltransferase